MNSEISWGDFAKVDIRTGTIISAKVFDGMQKPSYLLQIDFGPLGVRKTSAQLTKLHSCDGLIGRQILAVVNLPKKQIKNIMSECLVLGIVGQEGDVVLLQTERKVGNGMRVS
jgi:tRNA-binding protein